MRALLAAAALCFACAAPTAVHEASEHPGLAGTWYVLVQYRETGASDRDPFEVEDAVWRFERHGGRLRWTLFASPIHANPRDVASGTELPTAARVEEMTRGLAVTRRNAFEQTLMGSDASGWSSERSGGATSATAVSYTRRLRIAGLPARPVFSSVETLGGAGAEDLSGWTRYEALEVETDRLAGRYERDGERIGRFAMWRIASVRVRE